MLLTIEDVVAYVKLSVPTIHRWIDTGVTVKGQTVKLEVTRVGKSKRITQEALDEFIAACNPKPVKSQPRKKRKISPSEWAEKVRRRCQPEGQ